MNIARQDVSQEIEQCFIPTDKFAAFIISSPEKILDIIQGYVPEVGIKREINFANGQAVIKFSARGRNLLEVTETDAKRVAALAVINDETNSEFLRKARVRYQRDQQTGEASFILNMKGKKVNGASPEHEVVITDARAALLLLINYCKESLLSKTRYVKGHIIGGISRVLELDKFHGRHEGKYKLEIEHDTHAQWIDENVWKVIATHDVSHEKKWKNRAMAGVDEIALERLKQLYMDPELIKSASGQTVAGRL